METRSASATPKIDDSPLPLYQKLKNLIITRIHNGDWQPGQKIPSETNMMEQYRIARMTANRALRELTTEGYLIRVQGVGTFVANQKPEADILRIRSIADEINEQGGIYSNRLELLAEEKPLELLTKEMKLSPEKKIFHSIIVHMDRGIPIQIEDRYVNPTIAPDYLQQDFSQITPTEYLLDIVVPTDVEHLLEAILPTKQMKRLLKIGPYEPCLSLHRRTWSGRPVITHAKFIYPGTRYQIGGRFRPHDSDRDGTDIRDVSFSPDMA